MSTAEQGAVPKDRSHQSRSYAGQSHLVISADYHTRLYMKIVNDAKP